MLQPPMYPYTHPGMLGPPGMSAMIPPGVRYSHELLSQQPLSLFGGAKLGEHISPGISSERYLSENWNILCVQDLEHSMYPRIGA